MNFYSISRFAPTPICLCWHAVEKAEIHLHKQVKAQLYDHSYCRTLVELDTSDWPASLKNLDLPHPACHKRITSQYCTVIAKLIIQLYRHIVPLPSVYLECVNPDLAWVLFSEVNSNQWDLDGGSPLFRCEELFLTATAALRIIGKMLRVIENTFWYYNNFCLKCNVYLKKSNRK